MSTAEDQEVCPPSFAADQHRAEALLFDLATALRCVPVEESTRALHLRALTLRGELSRWLVDRPDGAQRDAFCNEVVALERQARLLRGRLHSGMQLAHREPSRKRGA